ncbi:phage tail protein [Acinetobacter bouvetii]|nr:phage tail protein [Acinetobacter bouvetii]
MSAKYYVTLTDHGSQLVAGAHHVQTINLTEMVIGDANDIPYLPIDKKDLTQLVHQTAAVEIHEIKIADGVATVSAIIPANIGGFNIHEIGLKDASGQLVYIGNYHGAYKPIIAEGAGGELEIVIDIKASSGAEALIEINPFIISADKAWVLEKFDSLLADIQREREQNAQEILAMGNQIKSLKQEVENLKTELNEQISIQDIVNQLYPVGSVSLSTPLNGVNGIVWGGLGSTYDVNPYTFKRTA